MCQEILSFYYNSNNVQQFNQQLISNPPIMGISVSEIIAFGTLYDMNNINVGNIQFNNINKQTVTFPPLNTVSENIQLQFDENTSITFNNYFKTNTGFYPNGSKFILPIISCTGLYVGKKGYVVIDVSNNPLNDKRIIYVNLH